MISFVAVSEIVADCRRALHLSEELRQAGFAKRDIFMVVPSDHACGSEPRRCTEPGCRLGWLVGVGDQALPGHGEQISTRGPGAPANGGIGGAREAFSETLLAIGIPDSEAARYRAGIRSGGVLVTVHVRRMTDIRLARAILTRREAVGSGVLRVLRPGHSRAS